MIVTMNALSSWFLIGLAGVLWMVVASVSLAQQSPSTDPHASQGAPSADSSDGPHSPNAADIRRLIRQLDSPAVKAREEATEALLKLGASAVPMLEQAAEGASFEARTRISEIIGRLRVRGVLILSVLSESWARMMDIEPGDIITHINGVPLASFEDFTERSASLENQPRKITVRKGNRVSIPHVLEEPVPAERVLQAGPGKMGVFLADYDGAYGEPLSKAMQLMSKHRHDDKWPEIRRLIEEAIAAGLVFDDTSMMEPVYAAACYFTGDKAAAYTHLDAAVSRSTDPARWWNLYKSFPYLVPIEGHLSLYIAQRQLEHRPDDVDVTLIQGFTYSFQTARYLDAVKVSAVAVSGQYPEPDLNGYGFLYDNLRNALDAMDLLPEAGEVVSRLMNTPGTEHRWSDALRTAERCGNDDAVISMGIKATRRGTRYSNIDAGSAVRVYRACVRQGKFKEARDLLRECVDTDRVDSVLYALQEYELRWAEAQTVLAECARQAIAANPDDRDVLEPGFMILSRLKQPDMAELERIVEARKKDPMGASRGEDNTHWSLYMRARLARLKGEYDESAKIIGPRRNDQVPGSFRDAVGFLQQHGAGLTGEQAKWRKTVRAFPTPAGGWYLMTTNPLMGHFENGKIHEIPLPETVWAPDDPNRPLMVSSTGKTVLAIGLGRAYRLRADESGWELLGRVPRPEDFYWTGLEPVLDELAASFAEGEGGKDLVWPEHRSRRPPEQMEFLMFSDGTWVAHDPEKKQLCRPTDALTKALGRRVEIYGLSRVASKTNERRVLMFTEAGLFLWRPDSGAVTSVELPGVHGPVRVMSAKEIYPRRGYRIALFPEDGGTTYIFNWSTDKVEYEGLVNEAYPETFWRQKSVEWKREQLRKTLAEVNLTWPFLPAKTGQMQN